VGVQYLTSNQNVLIYTTHIKKVIAKRYFFILRSRITEKQYQVRNFAEVRNFAWHRHSGPWPSQLCINDFNGENSFIEANRWCCTGSGKGDAGNSSGHVCVFIGI